MTPTHDSIRGWFAAALHDEMEKDERIWLLTGDLGFGMLDACRDDFHERFVNVGASEQLLIGAGVGLALSGKIPFCYSITTFLLFRPFEWIRYLNREQIPVRLVGSGMDDDYKHDGFSHKPYFTEELFPYFRTFRNIITFYPKTKEEIPSIVEGMVKFPTPSFICLRR